MEVQLERRAITVEEYHKMWEAGIFTEEERVELINGELITMSPKGSEHAAFLTRIYETIFPLLSESTLVRIQDPIQLTDFSEPEPDIAIVKRRDDYYLSAHPTSVDTFLIIEISDKTLSYDREYKRMLYAKSLIPEYWVINVKDKQIEIFKDPKEGDYINHKIVNKGEDILLSIIDVPIHIRMFLGETE